jgi:hypothetical protein
MSEYENRNPAACRETGLSCEACTAETATELARTCKGLRGKMVAQLFVQLYPAPACSRMHAHFAAAYRSASQAPASAPGGCGDEWEDIPTPTRAKPGVWVAVA